MISIVLRQYKGVHLLVISLMLIGCSVEPVPIEYGLDACHFCKMNIVDKQYAAEFVTQKGKVYKFDAIECMVQELNTRDITSIGLFLVTDYQQPGVLTDAKQCSYLKSSSMPSPMGADLTAFSSEMMAQKTLGDNHGEVFNWDVLLQKYNVP